MGFELVLFQFKKMMLHSENFQLIHACLIKKKNEKMALHNAQFDTLKIFKKIEKKTCNTLYYEIL